MCRIKLIARRGSGGAAQGLCRQGFRVASGTAVMRAFLDAGAWLGELAGLRSMTPTSPMTCSSSGRAGDRVPARSGARPLSRWTATSVCGPDTSTSNACLPRPEKISARDRSLVARLETKVLVPIPPGDVPANGAEAISYSKTFDFNEAFQDAVSKIPWLYLRVGLFVGMCTGPTRGWVQVHQA